MYVARYDMYQYLVSFMPVCVYVFMYACMYVCMYLLLCMLENLKNDSCEMCNRYRYSSGWR